MNLKEKPIRSLSHPEIEAMRISVEQSTDTYAPSTSISVSLPKLLSLIHGYQYALANGYEELGHISLDTPEGAVLKTFKEKEKVKLGEV